MTMTLKAARINQGYELKQAAALLGVSVPTLRNYENCITTPKATFIPIIRTAYDIPDDVDIIFAHDARKTH